MPVPCGVFRLKKFIFVYTFIPELSDFSAFQVSKAKNVNGGVKFCHFK